MPRRDARRCARASASARCAIARLAPVAHAFAYPTCFLMLPMRSLRRQADPVLARNRRALFGFRDADHGDGRADSLAWLDELLAGEGIADADGEVWLHCIPRMFGFAFKPVSFWYAHRADGTLAAIVVEVNNTFGERHCYLLAGAALGFGRTLSARQGVPRVAVLPDARRLRVPLHAHRPRGARRARPHRGARRAARGRRAAAAHQRVGPHRAADASAAVRFALWTLPAMTAVIVARIHWHALKLWLKKLPDRGQAGAAAGAPSRAARRAGHRIAPCRRRGFRRQPTTPAPTQNPA